MAKFGERKYCDWCARSIVYNREIRAYLDNAGFIVCSTDCKDKLHAYVKTPASKVDKNENIVFRDPWPTKRSKPVRVSKAIEMIA